MGKFDINILDLSLTKNIDEIINEWIFIKTDTNIKKQCICGRSIYCIVHIYYNFITQNCIYAGDKCKDKFNLKEIKLSYKDYLNKKINFNITEIINIDDIFQYSLNIMTETLELIKIKVYDQNLNLHDLNLYKNYLLNNIKTDNEEFKNNINIFINHIDKKIEYIQNVIENERIKKIENEKKRDEYIEKRRIELIINEIKEKEYIEKIRIERIEKEILKNIFIEKTRIELIENERIRNEYNEQLKFELIE